MDSVVCRNNGAKKKLRLNHDHSSKKMKIVYILIDWTGFVNIILYFSREKKAVKIIRVDLSLQKKKTFL